MAQSTLPRPVYAVAGAGELAAEQLKKLAAQAPEIQARAAELPQEIRKIANDLPRDLQNLATDIPSIAAQLQAKARGIDVDVVTKAVKRNVETARKNLDTAQHKAVDVYGDLVKRGERVVAKRQNGGGPANRPTPKTVAKKAAARKTTAKAAAKDLAPTPGLDVKAPLGKPAGTTNS
jgi:hypothetical protein